jgi:hypothetical protein
MNDTKHLECGDDIANKNETINPGDVFCTLFTRSGQITEVPELAVSATLWMAIERNQPVTNYPFRAVIIDDDEHWSPHWKSNWKNGEVVRLSSRIQSFVQARRLISRRSVQ